MMSVRDVSPDFEQDAITITLTNGRVMMFQFSQSLRWGSLVCHYEDKECSVHHDGRTTEFVVNGRALFITDDDTCA